jgi:membrane-bound ClpP family serine protease
MLRGFVCGALVVVGGALVVVGEALVVAGGVLALVGGVLVVVGRALVVVGETDVVFSTVVPSVVVPSCTLCALAGVVGLIASCKASRSIKPVTSTRAASISVLHNMRGMITPSCTLRPPHHHAPQRINRRHHK